MRHATSENGWGRRPRCDHDAAWHLHFTRDEVVKRLRNLHLDELADKAAEGLPETVDSDDVFASDAKARLHQGRSEQHHGRKPPERLIDV